MPALAIGGLAGSLIGGGLAAAGSLKAAKIGADAANNAANIQAQSAANALAFQKSVFNQQQQNFNTTFGQQNQNYNNASNYIQSTLSPYIQAGNQATGTLSRITGGSGTPADFSSFYNSPDYNFALQQGTRGVTNYENAQGMGMSGGALKDVAQFNQGLATQQYGNYFNRLLQIATMGSNAAGNAASGIGNLTGSTNSAIGNLTGSFNTAAGNMSNSIANTTQGIGQAQASGVVGSANAWTGGIANATNNSILAAALGRNPSAYGSNNLGNMFFGGGSPTGYGTG